MKPDKNHVELFDNDAMITLYDDQDNPIELFEVAGVEYEEKFYELLQPCEKMEGVDDDECIIFECITDEETNEKLFKPVTDEKILEAVFGLYLIAAADFEATDCGDGACGGECGGGKGCGKPIEPEAKVTPAKKPVAKKTGEAASKKPAAKKAPTKKTK